MDARVAADRAPWRSHKRDRPALQGMKKLPKTFRLTDLKRLSNDDLRAVNGGGDGRKDIEWQTASIKAG